MTCVDSSKNKGFLHWEVWKNQRRPSLTLSLKMACWDPSRSLKFWRHKSPISSGLPRWHQWQRTCLPKQEVQETLVWSLGRSPGIGNGKLLQYSCLDNPGDRRAWWAIVHGVAKSGTRLSDWVCMRAHTRTPISMHGPAIKLSPLQTLISRFAWPHYALGTWTCAQWASLCNSVNISMCSTFPRVLWKLFFPGFWGLQCHSLPWAQEFSTNRGTIQTV